MLCIDDLSELPLAFAPSEFRVREAAQDWERREAHALRRAVFCIEQGIFVGDDRDEVDDRARLLVAMACVGGMPDQVVGTVRIHAGTESDGTWWGSRLAVHAAFRHQSHLGATLIRLAVSLGHAAGCMRFHAHVQAQNVPMFERLHWQTLAMVERHGRLHGHMQADLSHYPPCADAVSGYVTRPRPAR